jgi:hypothetical protein
MFVAQAGGAPGGHDYHVGLDDLAVHDHATEPVASTEDRPGLARHDRHSRFAAGHPPPGLLEGRPASLETGQLFREALRHDRDCACADQGIPHVGQLLQKVMADDVAEGVGQKILHDPAAAPRPIGRRWPVAFHEHNVVALAGQGHTTEQPDRAASHDDRPHSFILSLHYE